MHKGHYISGAGHLTLIGWVLLGGLLSHKPPPFEMTQVSVISGADFDRMLAAQEPPSSSTEVAQPAAPATPPDVPEVASTPDAPAEQPAPPPVETPAAETPPVVEEQTPPPQADVSDLPPEIDEPVGEVAVLVPETAPNAVPRPVERVAPTPVAPPEPEATPDEVDQQAVAPDAAGETPQEPQEATAAPEATSEIVTEATAAPRASPRPPGKRPTAPKPQLAAAPAPTPEPAPPATEDANAAAIAAAVAAAQSTAEAPAAPTATAPSGPPLSAGEREGLRVAVAQCWNVGALSTDALQTVIVVSVNMNPDGTPIVDSMNMISFSGGSDASAQRVYTQARSAIVRCGSSGFPLPQEKYSQWQTIEMTFDPRKMGRL